MPKKSHPFSELSNKTCFWPDCGKRLKLRLVETRAPQNIKFCYKHYIAGRRAGESHRKVMSSGGAYATQR